MPHLAGPAMDARASSGCCGQPELFPQAIDNSIDEKMPWPKGPNFKPIWRPPRYGVANISKHTYHIPREDKNGVLVADLYHNGAEMAKPCPVSDLSCLDCQISVQTRGMVCDEHSPLMIIQQAFSQILGRHLIMEYCRS